MSAEGSLDGANFHCRAASSASLAKNWLGAAESSSAEATEPSEFKATRTLMRTVPRIVERAFSETFGKTWCSTEAEPSTGADSARGGWVAGRAAGFFAPADGAPADFAGESGNAGTGAAGCATAGAAAFLSGAREEALAGAGCEGWRVLSPGCAVEVRVGGVSRRRRGTIIAATTSVAPAPITKYFNEPRDTRGSAARRGAAIVTFT